MRSKNCTAWYSKRDIYSSVLVLVGNGSMFGTSELCLTNLEYRFILYFCGPTQKISLVKHWLSSSEASNTCPSTWFQVEVSTHRQISTSGAYKKLHGFRYSTWGAVGQRTTVQLLNLHPKQVQSYIMVGPTPLSKVLCIWFTCMCIWNVSV
jgi:hypothetical protein